MIIEALFGLTLVVSSFLAVISVTFGILTVISISYFYLEKWGYGFVNTAVLYLIAAALIFYTALMAVVLGWAVLDVMGWG